MGIASCYLFWRWLNCPGFTGGLFVGVVLGLAELTKFTLLVVYPLWALAWIAYRLSDRGLSKWGSCLRESGMLAGMLCLSIVVINIGYGFEKPFQPIGAYQFRSQLFSGADCKSDGPFPIGNRFADTWFASLPVPLPANFVQGIDAQRLDFERGLPSYLRGEWSKHGWWYYYLYALAIKIPLGTWCVVALAQVRQLLT